MRSGVLVKWGLNFLIPLCCLLIPESATVTLQVKLFLAITLWGVIGYALELTDNLVVSLVMMFMYGAFGVAPLNAVLGPWLAPPAWMTLGALILVAVVQKTTVLERMAYFAAIVTRGSYIKLILAMVTLALIARIFLQGTMACIAVIMVAYGMCESLGYGRSRASAGIMLVSVIGYMDANFFIYSPDFISILYNAASPQVDIAPSYAKFLMDNAVFLPGNYIVAIAIGYLCRPKQGEASAEIFKEKLQALGSMNVAEWKTICVLLALVIFLFTHQYHHIPMVYGFIFAPMLLYMPGIDVGTKQNLRDVPYSVLFFIVACMSIGSAGNAVHFGQVVSAYIVPIVQNLNETVFLYATFFTGALLNFLMTPIAEMAALGLPFAQICQDLKFNLDPMFYTFYQGCAQLWLPYETAVYLVAFSFGLIRLKDFALIMSAKFLINLAVFSTAGLVWWKFMGLL